MVFGHILFLALLLILFRLNFSKRMLLSTPWTNVTACFYTIIAHSLLTLAAKSWLDCFWGFTDLTRLFWFLFLLLLLILRSLVWSHECVYFPALRALVLSFLNTSEAHDLSAIPAGPLLLGLLLTNHAVLLPLILSILSVIFPGV